MFATSGYFKGVDCPYFLSGLCERPYCHFRHVKKDDGRDASSSSTASSGYVGGSRPSSPLDSALGQCSGPTGSKPVGSGSYLTKTGPTGSVPSTNVSLTAGKFVEEYSVDDEGGSDGPSYEPTPKYEVAGKCKRKLSTDCLYKPGGPAVEVPEYEPNHIPGSKPDSTAEYKPGSVPKFSKTAEEGYVPGTVHKKVSKTQATKRKANLRGVPEVIPEYVPSSVAQYNPTPINQLKKMKKNADTDLEYDPVNNYVCKANQDQEDVAEVVYVPSKRPKLEEEDVDDNGMCVDLDEFGDSDDARFSSDEGLDESELIMDSGRYESPLEEESDDEEVSEIFSVKPFFRDTSVDKSSDSTKESQNMNVCENDLKHPVQKSVSSQKAESDKTPSETSKKLKLAESDKSKSESKVKDKSDKSHKSSHHSSQSSSHKSSSKDTNGKSSDSSKKKDSSNSSSSSSKTVNGSHGSKSNKSSDHSKNKSVSSSSKSSDKKSDSSSGSVSHSKSNKNDDKNKVKHKEDENDKHKDSSKYSSTDRKHKSDTHKSHSASRSKNRSSSKDSSHQKEHHKDSKENSRESENKKSKDHRRSSSGSHSNSHRDGHHSAHKSSSSSSNTHSHSSKSGSKSEKENKNKHEKTKSSSSKSSKEKGRQEQVKDLANINVDLFGSESEEEEQVKSNNLAEEMTEAELARFLEDSDFESDDDTFEECLKIFNEDASSFSKQQSEKKLQKDYNQSKNSETAVIPSKRRVAHSNDSRTSKPMKPKVPVRMSPAQVMHNRIVEMQRRALEAAEARKAIAEAHAVASSSSTSQASGGTMKRQAHIPRSRSTEGQSLNDREEDKRTLAITVTKGQKRTAHAPTISNVKRPTIPAEFGGKVPSNIRQRYLNLIIDECLKICKTEEGAYKKGQEEETAVYKRATNKNIYLRVAVNAIKRLRVEAEQSALSPTKSSPTKIVKQSHEATLAGKNATKTTYTLHRSGSSNKIQTDDFRGAELYQRLSKYIMTEEQLKENGYPRPSPEGGSRAVFFKDRNEKDIILKAHEKNCVRCGKRFIVFPNGTYNREEECVYHWGKAWKKRVDRALVSSYNCCGGDLGAEGCQVCKFHVYESNKAENVTGYMKTIPSSPPIDGDYGVYAMDCEMVYTKGGMELARVTVIDAESKPVYEAIVKPDFPVIDYNTRFSGLTEEDLKGVKTTLRDVQAVLLSLFTDKTILIGHSLESDLISVKLIHNTVVDTSIVFPHRLGLPYKRALRNLMVDFLKKIIQDDVGGHDSQEDALACLQLMQWKLKEDAKKEIRRV